MFQQLYLLSLPVLFQFFYKTFTEHKFHNQIYFAKVCICGINDQHAKLSLSAVLTSSFFTSVLGWVSQMGTFGTSEIRFFWPCVIQPTALKQWRKHDTSFQ